MRFVNSSYPIVVAGLAAVLMALWVQPLSAASADRSVGCAGVGALQVAPPTSRSDPHSVSRMAEINAAVSAAGNVLFFGDSITERWPLEIWQRAFQPLGVVNAGIDGDRSEHLLWRLDHGNLDGPPPKGIVLWIGTNDLGHGRSPRDTAAGIRATLMRLRERLPQAPILLLGLLPRSDRFGRYILPVNQLIRHCDGGSIIYADVGRAILDREMRILPGSLVDGVHLTPLGYKQVTNLLAPMIRVLASPQ